ncbi:SAM-dependent methyltransferase [Streptomyces sp. NPDC050560]|uniref:SAM-dependent methyltransferase n=1 Tax=Streptomyces sp. NPDC050560 TaxID=3365630 RepID=UPI0037B2013F
MTGRPVPRPTVDSSRPHPARVYDWLLGGKDNYPVDRELAGRLPERARRGCVLNREFMHRAVAWTARQGVGQYLDIGTGIPTPPNLHQVVQEVIPSARVVYADNDPLVMRHAHALMISTPEGATDYVETDVREPERILEHARGFLDFGRPVALSMIALMHFIVDEDDPYGVVRTLTGALAPGSYLILTHGTHDFHPTTAGDFDRTYRDGGGSPLQLRSLDEVRRFFTESGLDMVEPGVVEATRWYKEAPIAHEGNMLYVGVGRVPG